MEQGKPRRYQGGKVKQLHSDYTNLFVLLLVLALVAALLAGCVIARKNDKGDPLPTSEVSASGSEEASSELPSEPAEKLVDYLTLTEDDLKKGDLVLINRTASFDAALSAGNTTTVRNGRLTKIQENAYNLPIGVPILNALESMQTGMQAVMKDDMVLLVNAGYRTAADQQALIDSYTESYGEDYVRDYVAPVGGSEHHSPFAADISFYHLTEKKVYATTSEGAAAYYSWVLDHCADYGLILRYTAEKSDITGYGAESWHFRYVGIPHAALIREQAFCLEEYLLMLKEYSFGSRLAYSCGGKDYEIYFVSMTDPEGTQVPIPVGATYTVSGNNTDGFIVTIEK